ncbi:MAG: SIS domain-containing protein, partial [Armatimonadetes bacterium]|nr:SIS domain-containing protein [Armatimonadota bacterium]
MTARANALASGRRTLTEAASALIRLSDRLDTPFTLAVETLLACGGRVVVTGMGKSGLIGRKIAATLASTGTPALFLHPAEALHGDLGMIAAGQDVVLALSYSGETDELRAILPAIKRRARSVIAVTGNRESS